MSRGTDDYHKEDDHKEAYIGAGSVGTVACVESPDWYTDQRHSGNSPAYRAPVVREVVHASRLVKGVVVVTVEQGHVQPPCLEEGRPTWVNQQSRTHTHDRPGGGGNVQTAIELTDLT